MSRWKAAGIHLSISLVLAAIVATLLYTLWFPPPYFSAAGANKLIPLLLGVDIVLGPLLTLVAISPLKPKRLRVIDLSVIATLQAVAFGYGFYVMCQARPVFIVAESDRIVLIAADDLSDADLAKGSQPAYRSRSWTGPRLVGAMPPKGNQGADLAMRVLAGGKDIDRLPEFYVPYEQVAASLIRHAQPATMLKPADAKQHSQLDALAQRHAGAGPLLFVPLERTPEDYSAVFTTDPGHPLAVLHTDPWLQPLKR